MFKDIQNSHKRRGLEKQRSRLIRPETIKAAFLLLRLIEICIRIISKFI